jgi:hypothetical protein
MSLHLLGISRSEDLARLSCPIGHGEMASLRHAPAEVSAQPDLGSIRWVEQGSLAAATLSLSPSPCRPLDHARLLEAVHRQMDVLPMRLGAVLCDDEAVRAFLQRRHADLAHDLDRMAGTCEAGLRIEFPCNGPPCPRAAIGRGASTASPSEYLTMRRQRYEWKDRLEEQAQTVADRYVQTLRDLYRDWRKWNPWRPGLVRLAFLVHRDRWEAFRERLYALRAETPAERSICVGPWPPYSFV